MSWNWWKLLFTTHFNEHVFDSNMILPLKIMDFENVFSKNNSLLCGKNMAA
jgi:hypothetical protein